MTFFLHSLSHFSILIIVTQKITTFYINKTGFSFFHDKTKKSVLSKKVNENFEETNILK